MKKLIVFCWIVIFSVSVSGQATLEKLLRAKALNSEGLYDSAVRELTGALSEMSDSRYFLERAESYVLNGDLSAAINDYIESNKITPFSGEYGLSRIYALKGDAQTALYHLEMNLKSSFRKSEKEIMLDPAFANIENRTEWRQFWKKERYTDLERNVSEIEYYTATGNLAESSLLLSGLRKNYGKTDETTYCEALVSLASGKPSEAVKSVSVLIAAQPENEKYLRILARAQEAASNPSGASDAYTRLLQSGAADAELLLSRANCYRKTGENERALEDINKYLEFYPGNKIALSMAGKTVAVSGDNLRAIEFFSKNLELHPNDPDCYSDRGNSYLNARSWNWAIKDYTMALDLKPGNPEAWLNKGIALLNSGRVQDACHDFRRAFSLGNKKASEYISRNCIK